MRRSHYRHGRYVDWSPTFSAPSSKFTPVGRKNSRSTRSRSAYHVYRIEQPVTQRRLEAAVVLTLALTHRFEAEVTRRLSPHLIDSWPTTDPREDIGPLRHASQHGGKRVLTTSRLARCWAPIAALLGSPVVAGYIICGRIGQADYIFVHVTQKQKYRISTRAEARESLQR